MCPSLCAPQHSGHPGSWSPEQPALVGRYVAKLRSVCHGVEDVRNTIADCLVSDRKEGRKQGREGGRLAGWLVDPGGNRFSATGDTCKPPPTPQAVLQQGLSRSEFVTHDIHSLLVFWARLTWWERHGLWNRKEGCVSASLKARCVGAHPRHLTSQCLNQGGNSNGLVFRLAREVGGKVLQNSRCTVDTQHFP